MFSYIINVIFSYIIDISKNIINVFYSLNNKNKEDLYLIEPNNKNKEDLYLIEPNNKSNDTNKSNNTNKTNNNSFYHNSISCPNNLYSHDKYKIKVNKPLVINLDLRCDYCKRLIMKDKSIYCFNDKIFCSDICRVKHIK
jgi:hypothetical protein